MEGIQLITLVDDRLNGCPLLGGLRDALILEASGDGESGRSNRDLWGEE